MQNYIRLGLLVTGLLQAAIVNIASAGQTDDSVHAWGRWEQMIAPAAGPEIAIAPVALVAPEGVAVLRPEEGDAFGRQLIIPNNAGPVIPGTGELPDVTDALPDTPIGSAPPTPAPPPPPFPRDDVTDGSGGPIGSAPPTPAPPPPPFPG